MPTNTPAIIFFVNLVGHSKLANVYRMNCLVVYVHCTYHSLFTTWARFPLFSQGIKFNIPRSLIVTGEGGAETIADNNSKTRQFIIQHIVTLPKYGHGELNICRPHMTDILRYT